MLKRWHIRVTRLLPKAHKIIFSTPVQVKYCLEGKNVKKNKNPLTVCEAIEDKNVKVPGADSWQHVLQRKPDCCHYCLCWCRKAYVCVSSQLLVPGSHRPVSAATRSRGGPAPSAIWRCGSTCGSSAGASSFSLCWTQHLQTGCCLKF